MSDRYYELLVAGWPEADRERFPRGSFHFTPVTGSTSDDLLARVQGGESRPFELIAADRQEKGRGRRGDRWEAPEGRNLLFSVALPLDGERNAWTRLPHVVAWVVGRAVESILSSGTRLQAKWPNDLLYDGRKLAGILVETVVRPEPWAVVGVGLNVNVRREEFPGDLEESATSLYEMLSCESSRWYLLGLMMRSLLESYPACLSEFDPVLAWASERSFLTGKGLRVEMPTRSLEGFGLGLGEDGELLLERESGTVERVYSAEKIWVC